MAFQKKLKKAENAIVCEHKEFEIHRQNLQKQLQSEVSTAWLTQASGRAALWAWGLGVRHTGTSQPVASEMSPQSADYSPSVLCPWRKLSSCCVTLGSP